MAPQREREREGHGGRGEAVVKRRARLQELDDVEDGGVRVLVLRPAVPRLHVVTQLRPHRISLWLRWQRHPWGRGPANHGEIITYTASC